MKAIVIIKKRVDKASNQKGMGQQLNFANCITEKGQIEAAIFRLNKSSQLQYIE